VPPLRPPPLELLLPLYPPLLRGDEYVDEEEDDAGEDDEDVDGLLDHDERGETLPLEEDDRCEYTSLGAERVYEVLLLLLVRALPPE
jgi:hypothetical protein